VPESRWQKLQALFEGALGRPEGERSSWLEAACGDDVELFEEVQGLLAADATRDDPMRDVVSQSVQDMEGSAMPKQGQAIGPWRILREIGRGGMGSVYLAERADQEYRREVAVKLIRGFPDAQSLERMRAERQILADLDHPNIAAMIDGGTTSDGQPYLVMQYIEGDQLDEWCRQHAPSRARRLALMVRLCMAVEYAHRNLVIHRDLKPGNVLVSANDQPMVLDFGIAKLTDADAPEAETGAVTRSGRYYTPGFSPPEQLSGEPVTTLADVFSLGKLLNWLLQRHPAAGEGKIPRELVAIIDQATAGRPVERYASVAALREDIERYQQGLPVSAAPARFGYRLGKFLRRHRLATAMALVAAVIAVASISRVLIESERARQAETQARLEAANANQVLDFLVDMIDAAGPARARGEPVEVIDVIDLARQEATSEAIADPALRARLLFALGRLYRTVESYAPAMELLDESARLARETGDLVTEVEALSMLGVNAVLNEEMDLAREPLERAVMLVESHPKIDPLLKATALNNYGIYLNETSRFDEARVVLEQSLALRQDNGAPIRTIATSFHNLGELEDLSGQPARARAFYERALELKEKSIGRLHLSYGNSLNGLSMTAAQLGDLATAQAAMQDYLAIQQQLLGEDHHSLWRAYNELAWQQQDMGNFQRALELYEKAAEHDRRSPGGAARDWLFTNNMGAVYRDWGIYDRAEALYRQSLALRIDRFGEDNLTTQRARHNLANALYLQGRLDEARDFLAIALAARRTTLDADHPDVLRSEALARMIDLAEQPSQEALTALRDTIDRFAARLDDDNFGVLGMRTLLGQVLIRAGELEAARRALEDVQRRLTEALDPDHSLALVLHLDLAQIEFLQGRVDAAEARLNRYRETLLNRFPAGSAHRALLQCLSDPQTRLSCQRRSEPRRS
jgi:serine/threonine-protein kinase